MAVTSVLLYFFLAITVCTLACGVYVVAEKVWGSRDRVKFTEIWKMRRTEDPEAGRKNDDGVNIARQGGPSVV